MANIKNLAIAEAVVSSEHVETRKSFFSTSYIYIPTQSKLKATVLDYSADNGILLQRLLQQPAEKVKEEIASKGKPQSTQLGNIRAEIVYAADKQFLAVQVFRFADFKYHPSGELSMFEGEEAAVYAELF